jgi:hypothetical protein
MHVEGGGGDGGSTKEMERDSVQPLKKPTKVPPTDLVALLTKA